MAFKFSDESIPLKDFDNIFNIINISNSLLSQPTIRKFVVNHDIIYETSNLINRITDPKINAHSKISKMSEFINGIVGVLLEYISQVIPSFVIIYYPFNYKIIKYSKILG